MRDLDTQRIAAAALEVLDAHGLAGFTMRAVADKLGVTPMALYHHGADKAALAALVVDCHIRERPLPLPIGGTWRDDIFEISRWTRESTLAHPNVALLRRQYEVYTPAMLAIAERWFGIWQQSGLSFDKAIVAANVSSMAIFGAVEQEVIARQRIPPSDSMMNQLPNARAVFMAERDPSAEFELLVGAVVDGLHTALTSTSAKRRRNQ